MHTFSQYLCFLIKSTILDISLSNCIHELYYRNFTCTCLLCDKHCLYWTVSTKFQNARRARAAVNRQGYFRIWCLILKESCSYCNYPEKFSVSKIKSPSRLSTNYRNTAFGRFEAGARAAHVPRSFGCNEILIYRLQTCFRQSGSKNNKPTPGRPRITTPLEVRVIVTST